MKKIALFPGSFDPLTTGHEDIILRALHMFDEIIIAIGNNSDKKYLFPLRSREESIRKIFASSKKISVKSYSGLTVDFCRKVGANFILRGLRSSTDFEYESSIARMNYEMNKKIETVFLMCSPSFSAVSSTIVRDIIRHGGDASRFVPDGISLILR